jgi:hypothetical protein
MKFTRERGSGHFEMDLSLLFLAARCDVSQSGGQEHNPPVSEYRQVVMSKMTGWYLSCISPSSSSYALRAALPKYRCQSDGVINSGAQITQVTVPEPAL